MNSWDKQPRGVFALEYRKHGCGVKIFCSSRANHASTNLKTLLSWKLDIFACFSHSLVSRNLENPYKHAVAILLVGWHFKLAWYSFSGSILPKFEHNLCRHKQRFEKIATTFVSDKDENLFMIRVAKTSKCYSNEMTPLRILLAAAFLAAETVLPKSWTGKWKMYRIWVN